MIILIKAVIFDIGGVTIRHPMKHVYKSLGKEFKIDWKRIKGAAEGFDARLETSRFPVKRFWTEMSKRFKIGDAKHLEKEWMKAFNESAVLDEKVVQLIKWAKRTGYKVAALSNTTNLYEKFHRKKGHYRFFDRVFLSNRLRMRKPNVGIYRYAIRELEVKPSECVFIDDKTLNVAGARKAGMKAIWFRNGAQLERDLKKYM